MPRYVVSRVMEALNDRGKPLKGSKVLVLGAATNRTSMMCANPGAGCDRSSGRRAV